MMAKLLGAFTKWALSRGKLDPDAPSHEAPDFRGYTIEDSITGAPYMTRVLFPKIGSWRPMLHNIHRADHERDLHNHPWLWAFSIVLSGEYDEERLIDDASTLIKRRVRRFNFLTSRDFHRITELHGDVWTLFVHGPRVQTWGFRQPDRSLVIWRDYIARQILAKLDQIDGAQLRKVARKWFDVPIMYMVGSRDETVRAAILQKVAGGL